MLPDDPDPGPALRYALVLPVRPPTTGYQAAMDAMDIT